MQNGFPNNNLYQELGLPNFAPLADVKKRFRELTLKHHPDRVGGDHKKMCALNNIFEILTKQKEEYDNFLRVGNTPMRVVIHYGWTYTGNSATTTGGNWW